MTTMLLDSMDTQVLNSLVTSIEYRRRSPVDDYIRSLGVSYSRRLASVAPVVASSNSTPVFILDGRLL